MSRSVLLQLARDSIQEVLEANRTINKKALLDKHPLLNEKVATTINLYINSKLRGTSKTELPSFSLLEEIIKNAKISAFEDKNFQPISTSEYLRCKIELILITAQGAISEIDLPIIDSE
ncbi:MAG: AMMECR1 domain-containing protein [Sulfurimonas sp.]|nr:AMMECR1 domain-containing protein [Sulfurimonas sp.]